MCSPAVYPRWSEVLQIESEALANGTTSYRILPGDHDEAEKDFSNTNMPLYARFWKFGK